MVNARLHVICGNCGSNDMFHHRVRLSINDSVEPNEHYLDVSLLCKNCSTLHSLEDNSKLEKDSEEYKIMIKRLLHGGKQAV